MFFLPGVYKIVHTQIAHGLGSLMLKSRTSSLMTLHVCILQYLTQQRSRASINLETFFFQLIFTKTPAIIEKKIL